MPELKFFWDYMTEHLGRIRRVLQVLEERRVRYALIGGHAVSYHWKPRLTVDVDFVVPRGSLAGLQKALPDAGFRVEQRGEILRCWEQGADPEVDDPVVDLVPAEYNGTQAEALRTAVEVPYQGLRVRIVSRPALVALKYLSVVSPHRAGADKHQDLADLGHVVKASWSEDDGREARRLVALTYPAAGAELDRLLDDLLLDRPITI